jgi:hypothetical protein
MKASRNVSFPHPVVGNADDAAGNLAPEVVRSNDRRTLTLNIRELVTHNAALDRCIAEGLAEFVTRVECGSTGFRKSYLTRKRAQQIKVPIHELYREVQIELGVIAKHDIPDYRPTDPHPDYGDSTFPVEAGDILAIAPPRHFVLDVQWDPLRAPMQSIMRIVRDDRDSGPMIAFLENDKIIVRVSSLDYDRYSMCKGNNPDVLHASLVLPVLIQAIQKKDDQDYQGFLWSQRLRDLLGRIEDDEDPLVAAQQLLRLPLERALKQLESASEVPDDD